ncbi:MAG TPA: DUF2461 domain-containing protein [Thermodesulfobacteriota bacterium]|nr:DUF2461 domain-containing protein [Thermodesulfobacteriota bacterium]
MTAGEGFNGFSKKAFDFLGGLEENNSREWFESNRDVFESCLIRPAQDFVIEMGDKLKTLSQSVAAVPLIDKSIFRIYRDTRFSEDKTPYKTHLGILFWDGPRKKLENPNYYVQLNRSSIFIGAGEYIFPPDLLRTYRDSVVHPRRGAELRRILKEITRNPSYKLGGLHYKRVPRGYDPEHQNAALLHHNGLYAYSECSLPEEIYTSRFIDYCFGIFRDIYPLQKWLARVNHL